MMQQRQPKSVLQTYEHNIQKRKAAQSVRDDYTAFVNDFSRAHGNQRSDGRVEQKRYTKKVQQQRDELMYEENMHMAAQKREYNARIREQDQRMAAVLWDQQNQKEAEARRAQRVCENSDELDFLKKQIASAQAQYTRAQQLEEQCYLEQTKIQEESALDQMMENDRLQAVKRMEEQQKQKTYANVQSRYALQHQMHEKEIKAREQWEAHQREKAMVDQIVADLKAEDQAKFEERLAVRNEFKRQMQEFLKDREEYLKMEQKHMEEVLRKIEAYEKLQQERAAAIKLSREKDEAQRDAVLKKLSADIIQKRKEAEEYRELLLELYDMEAERRAEAEIAARAEKKRRMVETFKQSSEEHRRHVEETRREQQRALEQEQKEMMEKFLENARLEEMNERMRKQKMFEHRRAVLAMIAEKKAMYEAAAETDMLDEQAKAREEEYRKQIIKRERLRLLRENAVQLRRFVPKSLFKTQEEIEAVWGAGALPTPTPPSPFGASARAQPSAFSPRTPTNALRFSSSASPVNARRTPHDMRSTGGTPKNGLGSPSNRFSSSLRMAGSSALGAGSPTNQRFVRGTEGQHGNWQIFG